jgi:hypothetical protein
MYPIKKLSALVQCWGIHKIFSKLKSDSPSTFETTISTKHPSFVSALTHENKIHITVQTNNGQNYKIINEDKNDPFLSYKNGCS